MNPFLSFLYVPLLASLPLPCGTPAPIGWYQTALRDDAETVLKQVEEATANLQSLTAEIDGTVHDQRPGRTPLTVYKGKLRLMKPNFAWVDFQVTTKEGATEKTTRTLLISNGQTVWKIDPQKNEYIRKEVRPDGRNIESLADNLPIGSPLFLFFTAQVPHMEAPPIYKGTDTRDGTTYKVLEFKKEMPAASQRLSVNENGLLQAMLNEQLEGKYKVDWQLKNVRTNISMESIDFAYVPPATATDSTQPAPKMLSSGIVAPDITVKDRAGKRFKLSDFKEKVVVLDFWSTGCGHSLESRAHLNSVAKKFGADVVTLAVHVWDKEDTYDVWLKKHPEFEALRFMVCPTDKDSNAITTLFQIPGVPAMYVIGRDGKIIRGFLGYEGPTPDLENTIKTALGNP